ncbi:MAG: AAA family ATPase [Deltaproteobacteria bacterium]|nr:AAA family ATPase [Deltaproteobacteria bacterium]
MKTIAFFNNKGGVGKTTLVYHLAHMLPRLGHSVLAVDLDPQSNLTSAFFDEEYLEKLWNEPQKTIFSCVAPIIEGTGDIGQPAVEEISGNLNLIAGDLALSRFEDRLSEAWPKCLNADPAALRATSAFYRITKSAAEDVGASVALLDVGPNLGAINRAALLAADYLVIPMAADLYSLQGLKNLGPTIRAWKATWARVTESPPKNIDLPSGAMDPAGYVVLQHAVRLDRPARAFAKWMERIPGVYFESVVGRRARKSEDGCLATLRNFRSLMPMSQEAHKPMFDLTPADGAIGSHAKLADTCRSEFQDLSVKIAKACGLRARPAQG